MASRYMNLWRFVDGQAPELVLVEATEEERKEFIVALSKEERVGVQPRSTDWEPAFERARTLVSGHLRRNPAHDGGGVKLEIKCYNKDLVVAQADIKEVWDKIRNGKPVFIVYDRGHKLVVTIREV